MLYPWVHFQTNQTLLILRPAMAFRRRQTAPVICVFVVTHHLNDRMYEARHRCNNRRRPFSSGTNRLKPLAQARSVAQQPKNRLCLYQSEKVAPIRKALQQAKKLNQARPKLPQPTKKRRQLSAQRTMEADTDKKMTAALRWWHLPVFSPAIFRSDVNKAGEFISTT